MPTPRKKQIDLNETPYYHCISRCVRRGFLCGIDPITGKNYNHRKKLIVERLKLLSTVFSINVCAYAVMCNHTHIVLHVDIAALKKLTRDEIIERWGLIYPLAAEKLKIEIKNGASQVEIDKIIEILRARLGNISWFMARLNEFIAKTCNKEDKCTGKFWEGRFKSQALLDESALLSAMVYVDLNPIRAGIADTPEKSEFTSIFDRIKAVNLHLKNYKKNKKQKISKESQESIINKSEQPDDLIKLQAENQKNIEDSIINFNLADYINLVDETGRIIRIDKKCAISNKLLPILDRLKINHENWIDMVCNLEKNFPLVIGRVAKLIKFRMRKRKTKGISASKKMFN